MSKAIKSKNNHSDFLESLFFDIKNKAKKSDPSKSYTAFLLNSGPEKIAKKIIEEAFEVAIASVPGTKHKSDKKQVVMESADLIYHLLVLLAGKNIELSDVILELQKRSQISGLEKKALDKALEAKSVKILAQKFAKNKKK